MRTKFNFTEAERQEIKARRARGDSQTVIARAYGCSVTTISRLLRDGCRADRKLRPGDKDEIRRRYQAGETGTSLAARYGIDSSWIYRICATVESPRTAQHLKITVRCLRCDRRFETRLAGRCPVKRLCPACTAHNEQTFCGALA